MARLQKLNGTTIDSAAAIRDTLAPLAISVDTWPTGTNAELVALLGQASLEDVQKETVLGHLDHYFRELAHTKGYQSRDLIVLHANVPKLDDMLAMFNRCHTHDDDEVRYIVDGEGVFGFVLPDGDQIHLTVEAGEYINVPAGTEHWFYLTDTMRIKAVRYFTGKDGWTPNYTGTQIKATN